MTELRGPPERMEVFVDTNIVVYAASAGPYRDAATAILTAIAEGRLEGRTSTAVIEEVWHVELSGRVGRLDGLARSTYELFTPLLPVSDDTVKLALTLDGRRLGANDRIHVATALVQGIGTIVSADSGLDGAREIRRLDPLDSRALAKLLGR